MAPCRHDAVAHLSSSSLPPTCEVYDVHVQDEQLQDVYKTLCNLRSLAGGFPSPLVTIMAIGQYSEIRRYTLLCTKCRKKIYM